MIRIDRALREQERRTRLLLQVHDELVLESPAEEAAEMRESGEARDGERVPAERAACGRYRRRD